MNTQIDSPQTNRLMVWLFNPFMYIAGWLALILGLLLINATSYCGFLGNNHTSGVLDLHPGLSAPYWFFLVEELINWFTLSLCLLIAGLVLSRSSWRVIDVFGTQMLSRFPMAFSTLVLLLKTNRQVTASFLTDPNTLAEITKDTYAWFSHSPLNNSIYLLSVIFVALMSVWMVALMYRAYAVSCNLKGTKAVVSFIICLITAELISKAAIITLTKFVLLN